MRHTLIWISFLQGITGEIMSEAQKLQRKDALAQLFLLRWAALTERHDEHWITRSNLSINTHDTTQQMRELLVPNCRNFVCTFRPK